MKEVVRDNTVREDASLYSLWKKARTSNIIAKEIKVIKPKSVLDINCGTGIFTRIFFGAVVAAIGIDENYDNIKQARSEISFKDKKKGLNLIKENYRFVHKYNRKVDRKISSKKNRDNENKPVYTVANIMKLPFNDESFDFINITDLISNIDFQGTALIEVNRVLKPGGFIFFDVNTVSFIDNLKIEINKLFKKIFKQKKVNKKILKMIEANKKNEYMKFTNFIFNEEKLVKLLNISDFSFIKKWSIHSYTSIISDKVLKKQAPSFFDKVLFFIPHFLEEKLPFFVKGKNLIVLAKKGIR